MTDKPNLQPPSRTRSFSEGKDTGNKTFLNTGIIILVAFALAVVFILPDRFGNKDAQKDPNYKQQAMTQTNAGQTLSSGSHILSETVDEIKINEARDLLKKTLKMLADLESQGVKTWGSYKMVTSYEDVLDSITKANSHLDSERFDEAIKWYNRSIEQLEQLSAGREKRLQQSLTEGQKAVSRFDSNSALRHFTIALAVEPDNEEAKKGISRTNLMGQVIELIKKAGEAESSGKLDLAGEIYRNAFSLDSGYQTVNENLRRINGLILERDFKDAMSAAMAALIKKDFSKARIELNRAGKLRPNDPGVKDLEQQIDKISLATEVQNLKKKAAGYEIKEKWQEALGTYTKILKADANAAFAQKGRAKALEMIDLYSQIENYISNPNDLQPLKNIGHARNLYTVAVSMTDAGPELKGMAEKLNKLIDSYSRTAPVLFQSDNMTEVTIYKVGQFDKFNEKMLDLRPGQYKALGTRSGYRDVIVQFTVPPDSKDITTVLVSCEEKI
jgi:tetratricopeptide (TPR) repeat protein